MLQTFFIWMTLPKTLGWKKLFLAIQKREWKTAAKESHREGLHERNDSIFLLFSHADKEATLSQKHEL